MSPPNKYWFTPNLVDYKLNKLLYFTTIISSHLLLKLIHMSPNITWSFKFNCIDTQIILMSFQLGPCLK